ncbi:transmembrane and TPR repeat-containing protein 3 [Trichonephila clavipes]|nr:transmembrane and TPR repeat-containing protein 3 [Trichonephila clavipes]
MLGSRTDLHIFDAGSVNRTRYCNEILLPYVRLFRGAMGLQFLFMDDNAPCHRTVAAEQLLESEDIERMDWPARSPDLNPIENCYKKVLKLDPANQKALHNRCVLHFERQDFETAERCFVHTLTIHPGVPYIRDHLNIVRSILQQGQKRVLEHLVPYSVS